MGEKGVGKTSLISLLENYSNDNYTIKNVSNKGNDNDKESVDSDSESLSMIEPIKRVKIDFNEDRNLYFNLYETDLNNYESIKMNLDTLLYKTEFIIIMWDSSNPETFDNIPNLISTIEAGIEQFKFENVPIFILQNKIDLEANDDNEEINDLMKKFKNNKNISFIKISLYDKDDFYNLLLDIYRKMEILGKESNEANNKFKKNNFLFQIKIQYPLKHNNIKINNANELKLLLLGDEKVGKTSFMNNLLRYEFNKNININFPAEILENKIDIEIIEENCITNLSENTYKNADGILLFVDLTIDEGLNRINEWISSIKNNFGEINNSYDLFLLGNKTDENEKRKISKKDAKYLAEEHKIKYIECSNLLGLNNYEILNEMLLMSFNNYNNKNKNIIENKNKSKHNNEKSQKDEEKEEIEEEEIKKEEEEEEEENHSEILNKKSKSKNEDNKNSSNIIKNNLNIKDNEDKRRNDIVNNKQGKCNIKLIDIVIIIIILIIYFVAIIYYI